MRVLSTMARKSGFYSPQINTVLTRNLILAILRGDLKNESDVAKWIDGHRSSEMPIGRWMVPD